MKKMKSLVRGAMCMLLALLMGLTTIACTREDPSNSNNPEKPVDDTKTQLYVANYYGGLGDQWLWEVIAKFEAANAETSFEEGKIGVQVHVYNDKTIDGAGIASTLANDSGDSTKEGNAIYFTETVRYYELLNAGVIADITDIVTAKNESYDLNGDGTAEMVSIADKMDPTLKEYFETKDGKYYALPFYNGTYGMYYDVDLFDEMGYYFADVTSDTVDGSVDNKSVGPDGIAGTQDDGLPATYEQFDILMTQMRVDSVYPFVWTAAYSDYFQRAMANIWVDYEGYEQAMLNVTFDGVAKNLITVDANGNITKLGNTVITPGSTGNGSLLQQQAGKYYTLKFVNNILSNGLNYDPLSVGGGLTHTGAQERFLKSRKIAGKEGAQVIAMIIDGNWWENEADGVFSSMANSYGSDWSRSDRKFAVMPTPKASVDQLGKATIYDTNASACFINANTPASQMAVAKAFLAYCHTNEAMSLFNAVTSMPKPYKYTITDEDMEKISYYGLSSYEYWQNADVVYSRNDEDAFFLNNENFFSMTGAWGWTTSINGQKYEGASFIGYFRNGTFTPEQWFSGMYSYHKANWQYLYG